MDLATDVDHVRGPLDAPVTLVEYGDFECPYCGQAEPVIRELVQTYGNDLRFVFRHLPLVDVHEHAALAAEAAGDQGRFWEMHDLLMSSQQSLTYPDLLRYAVDLGLDVDRFSADLQSWRHIARIHRDVHSADASGAAGTPNDVRQRTTPPRRPRSRRPQRRRRTRAHHRRAPRRPHPGSADLPLMAKTLNELADTAGDWPVLSIDDRWIRHTRASGLLAGTALVQTDPASANLLVTSTGIRVVDWAGPAVGAPWIDTGLLLMRLVDAGHTQAEAERWAATVPVWSAAGEAAVNEFVSTIAAMWRQRAQARPAPHRQRLSRIATVWERQRIGLCGADPS